jgi:spore germination protein YaaH
LKLFQPTSFHQFKHLTIAALVLVALPGTLPLTAHAAGTGASPADAAHPLVMQEGAAAVASATLSPGLTPFQPAQPRAAVGGAGGLQREVFGFALASSLASTTYGFPTWNFSLLSTVAFFGLDICPYKPPPPSPDACSGIPDGGIAHDSGWSVWNSSQLTGLLNAAHASGTKVVVTIVLQDFASGTPTMCAGLAARTETVKETEAEVSAKGVDGVNIDFEGLSGTCANGQNPQAAMTDLVRQLRAAPALSGKYLSIDTYASSAADSSGFFDVPLLAPYVDSFFVMAYDMEQSNWSYSPPGCTSLCLGPTAPLAGYHYNDTTTAAQYSALVSAAKVILGVPYYGRKACVANPSANAYPVGARSADKYLDAAGESTAAGTQSYASHRDANDSAGSERWDTWFNSSLNCTRELYWDDTTSLGLKYDLVNADHLRGVGIWNLNFGGGAPELWNLLGAKFASTLYLGGSLTSGPDASAMSSTHSDVFVRGADNALWHRYRVASGWSDWERLGGYLTTDPTAVSWGPNRVDVFAAGTNNGLWHLWWDPAGWHGWESLGGILTSGPDAASRGSGLLDVYARGTDSGLWHIWWDAAGWHGWQSLGGIITSDPSAVAWGPSAVDAFARGTDNGLWRLHWDGTSWSGWQPLGGALTSSPDASSCAASTLDVFALGTDSGLWRRSYSASGWTAWQSVGSRWTSSPGATCLPGTTSIEVFERGTDNGLWYLALT